MKKIILIIFVSLMFANIGFAAERDWIATDYTISYYLKNGWALTFVTLKDQYKTVYTLQTSKKIVSCRVKDMTWERCYKPADQ